MATELPDKLGNNLAPMLGVELKFDESRCIACGNCATDICFLDAIKINSTYKEIDFEKCRCCGRCVETCPEKALTIKIESDSVNKSIEHVKPLVDIESE
jgi:ferredoxin